MKKLFIMAAVALLSTSAFAQNPDALKQIKKAKTAEEVKTLLKTNESSMSAAENAQAYNKLVDFAMKGVAEGNATMQAIELQKQMGQEPKETVDMPAFYAALAEALEMALICDKYDIQPNAKGKVSPKFRSANAGKLYGLRPHLVNAGQDAQSAGDGVKAGELFGIYVVSGKADLFKEEAEKAAKANPNGVADEYLSEVARVAALTAFNNGDVAKALEYTDIVMEDNAKTKEGINLKLYFIERSLKTKEDSLRCLEQFKEMYAKYPQDSDIFSQLAQMYGNLGQGDKQKQLISERLQAEPDNFSAWAMKGQTEMNEQKYDDALVSLKKALTCKATEESQKALVNTFIGFCYNQKAVADENYDNQIALLKEAIPYLEEARRIDPNRERSNWGYPLYQCYYNVKGEKDPATVELKNLLGL